MSTDSAPQPPPADEYRPSGTPPPPRENPVKGAGTKKRRRKDHRKTTIEHQAEFLPAMLKAFARRAKGEDPGLGLRTLLDIQALVNRLVDEVGVDLYRQIGPQQIGDDLGWTRQRVFNRWGAAAAASGSADPSSESTPPGDL